MEAVFNTLANNKLSIEFFNAVGLPRLSAYWPYTIVAAAAFEAIFRLAGVITPLLFSSMWSRMKKVNRYKWCVRKVSTCHAAYMVTRSLVVIANTKLRNNPVHGSDAVAESAYAVTLGYFLWDIINTYQNIDVNGWQFMIHGIMSFGVYLLSFSPLLQYYGACFMMFEISTLFLNVHNSLEDLNLQDFILYFINGMALVSSFFFARIVYGTMISINVWRELANSTLPINPLASGFIKLANIVLLSLSYYWFGVIIMTVKRSALDVDLIRAINEMENHEDLKVE
ncbi:hypothetical protein GGI25_003176 [Coemansia spiralis]|uniref:TLC domain-containing protein n=2 Tax=Coemansia TaxID=4863 RepID=A0A9W8G6F9_9FUNG|nr:hypothetical protein EDC05_003170 [Coemansia umbellata]KAJ2621866.1 hypothetical protein GGI26_003709 [Coemansia sp. RSA 1358]KAJ2677421.1 hypothetical protein GGI25_003176 [Coemansia spiralis]